FLQRIFVDTGPIIGVAGAAGLLCRLGVVDDIWDLHWMAKLAGQALAPGFMALKGVALLSVPFRPVIIGSPRLSPSATGPVVLGTIHGVNLVDGLDGLAAGVVSLGGSAFFRYSFGLARDASPATSGNLASLMPAIPV